MAKSTQNTAKPTSKATKSAEGGRSNPVHRVFRRSPAKHSLVECALTKGIPALLAGDEALFRAQFVGQDILSAHRNEDPHLNDLTDVVSTVYDSGLLAEPAWLDGAVRDAITAAFTLVRARAESERRALPKSFTEGVCWCLQQAVGAGRVEWGRQIFDAADWRCDGLSMWAMSKNRKVHLEPAEPLVLAALLGHVEGMAAWFAEAREDACDRAMGTLATRRDTLGAVRLIELAETHGRSQRAWADRAKRCIRDVVGTGHRVCDDGTDDEVFSDRVLAAMSAWEARHVARTGERAPSESAA
ncbi:hypothetical protein [Burkholderia pseudomallei]|uniref:hypothetical protein n=1 Tax=Burkholderia pseudomallei TaxID=28450 RepID=UPI000F275591|nr:hypothetical protein [Burkholderia pseudomallei]CAJ3075284.1 Uncharacterised protein [Burkholderia pseudomallei]VCK72645.1 Uncharacterised protein [Burkholderia pseudomallei]VCK79920.1 Uncharacterised protein [Burkholderia pseudomallei]VCK80088.1 Uncharacterised protein [Burkholderia pseudomallei]VCK80706.1 Uncharacterised protein [Burkholderia pseudomallei]